MPKKVPWWVVSMLKGGSRKSTTAIFLAFALARSEPDKDVLLVDGDYGTQGVTDWASRVYADEAELPFHVVQWAPSQGLLVPFVQRQAQETGAHRVVIDLGGEAPEVVRQALVRATIQVGPVGPEQGEMSRVAATASLARAAGVPLHVLLTRVPRAGVGAAAEARKHLVTNEQVQVLTTEIPQDRDTYAHVWGTVPASLGQYGALADELRMLEATKLGATR